MLEVILGVKTVFIFWAVFGVLVAYLKARPPRKNYPRGPPLSPFTGNMKYCTHNFKLHQTFVQLAKQYGPIFSLQLGWYPHVVISDYKIIKEALLEKGNQLTNRFNQVPIVKMSPYYKKGLALSEGKLWKATRRLAIHSLRDFGFGKDTIEERIMIETEVLLQEIGKYRGEPFKFDLLFNKATANIMCAMLFGKRFDYKDKDFVDVLDHIHTFMAGSFCQGGATLFLPYALPWVFLSSESKVYRSAWDTIAEFLNKQIKEHRQNFDSSKIKDFADVFLEAKQRNAGDDVHSEKNLFKSIMDLLLAGSETASTTLLWAMLFMLQHPDIQDRCREDILQLLGKDTKPCIKDREHLPYVEAVICEVQRLGNIAPQNQFSTQGPVELQGYTLPHQTAVTVDYYSVHMDPKLWGDPEQFRPERFLNEGNKVVRPPYFMPFGIGKRACLGENLAKSELFLFFTSMLQNYKFTCEDREKLPTIQDGRMGFTLFPGPYEVMANPV